jgi:hypothetical protein
MGYNTNWSTSGQIEYLIKQQIYGKLITYQCTVVTTIMMKEIFSFVKVTKETRSAV